MHVGVIAPQGWTGEYDGREPRAAWARTVAVAQQAERLGFESIWLFDHYHTKPEPTDEITFESFTSLTALATLTSRVRLGHVVVCAGFRNPALVAKMVSTMDVISGGRMELGLGAGWKRDEWIAYGYGFPGRRERLDQLADALEIVTRMLAPGRDARATFEGKYASVHDAINQPKPLQERLPIIVGGNGPEVTWRLAARFADELNLDGMDPAELSAALPTIRARCEEIGRDPSSLSVSIYGWWDKLGSPGAARAAHLAALADLGLKRVMTLVRESADTDEALESLAADCLAAGVSMRPRVGGQA
jgi:F420-dependent oxidoreductase-like protein